MKEDALSSSYWWLIGFQTLFSLFAWTMLEMLGGGNTLFFGLGCAILIAGAGVLAVAGTGIRLLIGSLVTVVNLSLVALVLGQLIAMLFGVWSFPEPD